jgi:hypothetical protein
MSTGIRLRMASGISKSRIDNTVYGCSNARPAENCRVNSGRPKGGNEKPSTA